MNGSAFDRIIPNGKGKYGTYALTVVKQFSIENLICIPEEAYMIRSRIRIVHKQCMIREGTKNAL